MCQLLGMNSFKPAELSFSLAGFLRRGGATDEHEDGWGIAFFEEDGCRVLIDEQASARSPLAQWVQRNPVRSRNVVAHVRKATQGAVNSTNCHPFVRDLWGQRWAFAHNGNLDMTDAPAATRFHAVGTTDSEQAFCLMFDALVDRFGAHRPPIDVFSTALAEISAEIARRGSFNYVLSNGDLLHAHCSTDLHYIERAAPFGRAQLLDCEIEMDFASRNHLDDRIVVVATRPLSDEQWTRMKPGELVRFAGGRRMELDSGKGLHFAI